MLSLGFYGSMPLLFFWPLNILHLSVKVKVSPEDLLNALKVELRAAAGIYTMESVWGESSLHR